MNAETRFEVAIVGGGVVGAALACALRGGPVALLAQQRTERFAAAAKFDARVYAISPGNAAFLAQLGAWGELPPARLTPVHAMRVHGDDGSSRIEFDAYSAGASELAWIVEDGLLQECAGRLVLTARGRLVADSVAGLFV